jgi:hypothetical protein
MVRFGKLYAQTAAEAIFACHTVSGEHLHTVGDYHLSGPRTESPKQFRNQPLDIG